MRIAINLASRPFVELRPLFARLRITMAGLALLAIALGAGLRILSKRVAAGEEQMRALQAQTTALQNQRRADENRMRQPENQAVLERSRFLNDVFQAKSFSWTAVMMDLENVLPAGVQVTSIEPGIAPDGEVNMRLKVSGDREREVDLVRNLERSQRFVSPRIVNESAQSLEQGRVSPVGLTPGGVEFDIFSGYNPLPAQKAAAQTEKPGSHSAEHRESSAPAHATFPVAPPAKPGSRTAPPVKTGGSR